MNYLKELLKYISIALLIVLPIRYWIAQPFVVNGSSMDDTFKDGEYLIVDQLTYNFKEPQRGDVLVFKYPLDKSRYFIKRIIALPGENIIIDNDSIIIKNENNPEGILLIESYIKSESYGNVDIKLKDDEYFVMGDNRMVSLDSRSWGPLNKKDIIGRPFLRLLPINRIDKFPGNVSNTDSLNKNE